MTPQTLLDNLKKFQGAFNDAQFIKMPVLEAGEVYAGLMLKDGVPDYHLIVTAVSEPVFHEAALESMSVDSVSIKEAHRYACENIQITTVWARERKGFLQSMVKLGYDRDKTDKAVILTVRRVPI